MPLVGEVTLTEPKVIELAGGAAEGAIAHVGLTATATDIPGIAAFAKTFEETFKRKPTHDAIKGYIGAWATKYVTEMVGKLDWRGFRREDARPVPQGGGLPEDAARHLLGPERRDVPPELHGPGQGGQRRS